MIRSIISRLYTSMTATFMGRSSIMLGVRPVTWYLLYSFNVLLEIPRCFTAYFSNSFSGFINVFFNVLMPILFLDKQSSFQISVQTFKLPKNMTVLQEGGPMGRPQIKNPGEAGVPSI